MTIAELERRSGLTRANIRFYEAEGLLRPARRENGYRDYSEEDLALLLRVRLLRELGLPLAEIRQLRGGDLALGAALDAHLARLGVELERAERSQAVCRDILGSGESFEALDAPRWLAELSARGPKPAEGFDSVPPLICPWRRFFARNLDLMLCTILPLAAAALLFRPNYQPQGFGFTVIRTLVTLAALFVAEPLLLHFWGTTPGKWLLGLSVESESGGRLSLGEAWGRTTGLICYGLGFYLPLVSLVTCAVSYQKHSSGRPLSWEAGSELRLRDRGRAAGVAARSPCDPVGLAVNNGKGRRGRRPLQGGCDATGPAVIQRPGGGGTPPLRWGRRQARVGAERPPPISAGAFLFVRFSHFFGKLTLISVPRSSDSRLMRPLWYWAACFTMDRPRPVPPVALEWLLSTR